MPRISFPVVETKIRVDKEIKAGDRTLFTVARISIMKTQDGAILGIWLTPLAMLIVEPGQQYAISFTEEKLSVDEDSGSGTFSEGSFGNSAQRQQDTNRLII